MLGGAACSYPKELIKKYPYVEVDVVEIDKKLIEIAKQEFRLEENERLHFYYEDGSTFLNKNEAKYDVIYGDAFNSLFSIPYQLTTKEAIEKMYSGLSENGAVIVNIISPLIEGKNLFLRAEYSTYKSVFPYVYIFQVDKTMPLNKHQSICLVAVKNKMDFKSEDEEISNYL